MLRRTRTTLALTALLLPLAACGSDSEDASDPAGTGSGTGESISGVSFSGEVGEALEVEWDGGVENTDATEVTTLVEGDGEEIAEGDVVTTYLYVANGTT